MCLETENLEIRNAVASDSEFLATIQTNEEVQKYIGGVLDNFENTLDYIKKHPENLNDFYVVILKRESILIGIVSFVPNRHLNDCEVLIAFMPDYQGNGYGPETLAIIKEFWLDKNKISYMFATAEPENKDSISMLERQGFRFIEDYEDPFCKLQKVYRYERIEAVR